MIVVSNVTISTTNMTGFRINVLGSSLTKADQIAGQMILGSKIADAAVFLRKVVASMDVAPRILSEEGARLHCEVLDDGAERERREERQSTDDENDADDQADEKAARRREGAR